MNLRAAAIAAAAIAAIFAAIPATAEDHDAAPSPFSRLSKVALAHAFEGEIAFSTSHLDYRSMEFVPSDADASEPPPPNQRWPWASVTKQVLTVLIMQEVEAGRIDLDAPASRYLPRIGKVAPTVRQLLQHRAGLRNPDDSPPDATGIPDFYTTGPTGVEWCLGGRGPAGGDWRYNNCDYIVLGVLLEKVTKKPVGALIADRIGNRIKWTTTVLATTGDPGSYRGRSADYDRMLSRYGTAAGLVGPLKDMLVFARSFFGGHGLVDPIFSEQSRDAMWQSDPALGFMALGQWVFEAPLAGCEAPVRIVERRGAIGKYQVRNIILPASKTAIAIATDKEDFDFGEIWTGTGFMHDTLAALACG